MIPVTFTMPQKVLFKHCDPAGIVFYPRYFEMINDCVEAYFDDVGFPFETLHGAGGVPTVQIETRFHAPSRHGDRLTLALDVIRIGGASLGLSVRATAGDELRLSAELTLVHVDNSCRPAPWPGPMRDAFQSNSRSPR